MRSGATGRVIRVPDDVVFDALLAARCNQRPAGVPTISFFASGMSCGGTIALTRLGIGYRDPRQLADRRRRDCPRRKPLAPARAGFTLIEVLVALALVAIALAAIGSLIATNSRGAWKLEQHAALVNAARVVVSTLPRAGAPMLDDLRGQVAGHRWQMRLTPFLDDVPVVPKSRFVPQRVELRVQAPGGAIVSFETIRLQSRGGS